MNNDEPRDRAAPAADAAQHVERRFARHIDCAPRERQPQHAGPPARAGEPTPPHKDAHP